MVKLPVNARFFVLPTLACEMLCIARMQITRQDWQAKVDARKDRLGGDFCNEDSLSRAVFRDPQVLAYSVDYMGSGLWADVFVLLAGEPSEWFTRRIH